MRLVEPDDPEPAAERKDGMRPPPPPAVERGREREALRRLARSARDGDRGAMRSLLDAVGPTMLRIARGVLGASHRDLDDVVQDAMVGFVRALPAYREECTVKHFAARIAVRTAADHLRRLARLARSDAKGLALAEAEGAPAMNPGATAERRALVVMLLDELSEVQAEALVLRAVMGCAIDEIAAATGVPGNTVRSRIRLAKQAIARRLDADPELRALIEAGGDGAGKGRT